MVTEVGMPKFGLSMETGIIGEWMVKEGDSVKKGDALAEINTDKISNTAEAPCDGFVLKLLAEADDELECGAPICLLADSMDEAAPAAGGAQSAGGAAGGEAAAAPAAAEPAAAPHAPAVAAGDVKITPRAKKIAEEKGLSYAHIQGTGLLGMITIEDLKKHGKPLGEAAPASAPVASAAPAAAVSAAPAPAAAAAPAAAVYDPSAAEEGDVVAKMTPMQTATCRGMMNSIHGMAQITIATEADVSSLVKTYKSIKGKYVAAGVKLSYTAMLIKSVAQALENNPKMRTSMVDDKHIKTSARIHVGCAVDVPSGLLVPVIRDANLKDLRSICLELAALSEKAKAGQLEADEMGNATITITNLGMFGITYFTPIINAPEGSILGVGAILEKLLVKDGAFVPGSVMNLSLTHDHRFIDGAPAARFLQEVVAGLQDFKWL